MEDHLKTLAPEAGMITVPSNYLSLSEIPAGTKVLISPSTQNGGNITEVKFRQSKFVSYHIFSLRFVTRGQFWPSGIFVGCVCLSVCLCVR